MLPFKRRRSFPFSPKQGFGIYGFHPGAVRKTAIACIIGAEGCSLGVQKICPVGEHKGIVSGGADYAVRVETFYGQTITGQDIFFRARNKTETGLLGQRGKGDSAVFRAGQDFYLTMNGTQGFHNPEDEGPSAQGKKAFLGEAA
jgi:hypothetical protein